DLSSLSHTGECLSERIKCILEEIGINKFAAIVSDGRPNIKKAREMVHNDFPFILNLC
ncbi:12044_t:CDS:1, partial [Entrophospora sp. SA101]